MQTSLPKSSHSYSGKSRSGEPRYDLAIVGAGLTGLLAAWAGVRAGLRVLHIAPRTETPDGRTTALLQDSIAYLQELGLWEEASTNAHALKTMRIVDATNRLIRAPQVDFRSSEVGLEAFGYNIENSKLAALLEVRLTDHPALDRRFQALGHIGINAGGMVELQTDNGERFVARYAIAADGRNSAIRKSLGIGERSWKYPQIALVGNFSHTLPHHDVSTEFHTPTGPFTLVPLGDNRSSLVCVVDQAQADRLRAMEPARLNGELEERMGSMLGKVTLEGELKNFPLSAMVSNSFGKGPVALVGEAAHVFPPIGAQGLNLGLRDVREAISRISAALSTENATDMGLAYDRARRSDITMRTTSVDMLNRSLLSDFIPLQLVRSLGLYTVGTIGPLRRMMMREGVAPGMGIDSFRSRLSDMFHLPKRRDTGDRPS